MPEPSPAPEPEPYPNRFMEGVEWWAMGVVDGFRDRTPRKGIGDCWIRYASGWAHGMELRHKGGALDDFLASAKVPYREAHFRPRPPLLPGEGVRS